MRWLWLFMLITVTGCTNTVRQPERVGEPTLALLVDYGRHSSLILPRADGSAVEYASGEWRWFALNHDGWWRAPGVMLLPNRATLGRSEWPSVPARVPAEEVISLTVEREKVKDLLSELDAIYARHEAEAVDNQRYGLRFVPVEQRYWMGNNCNHVTARWLEALGCRVTGWRGLSNWRALEPSQDGGGG